MAVRLAGDVDQAVANSAGDSVNEANLPIAMHAPGHMEASPFAIPSKKLVMWLFIISDAVTFAAILFAYGYIKNASPNWPMPFKFSPSIINVLLMTFILVSSSLTMLIATRAAKAGDKPLAFDGLSLPSGAGPVCIAPYPRVVRTDWLRG